jgi:hypothetical protein
MKELWTKFVGHLKTYLPQNWKQIALWFATVLVTFAMSLMGFKGDIPAPPIPIFDPTEQMGWVPDPEAVDEVARQQMFYSFSGTPAGQSDDPLPQFVYLWHAEKKITGTNPKGKNQKDVGSCVSFGTNNAIRRTMAVQIAIFKASEELKDIAEEVTYAGSRVEVGGGKIRGDGSVGAWAAKFVRDWGVVERTVHGKHDLSTYDTSRCRSWGNSGVPAELETLAKEHPVKEITLVRTWAEAKRALANGYGIAICSNQGFNGKRDAQGVKRPSGSWAHCMALDGYHIEGGKEYGHIENSWGERPDEGPVGWGDPPASGFWVEASVIDRMLKAGDSWAFSAVKGFPARQIDWFVSNDSERTTLYAQLMRPVIDREQLRRKSNVADRYPGAYMLPGTN